MDIKAAIDNLYCHFWPIGRFDPIETSLCFYQFYLFQWILWLHHLCNCWNCTIDWYYLLSLWKTKLLNFISIYILRHSNVECNETFLKGIIGFPKLRNQKACSNVCKKRLWSQNGTTSFPPLTVPSFEIAQMIGTICCCYVNQKIESHLYLHNANIIILVGIIGNLRQIHSFHIFWKTYSIE